MTSDRALDEARQGGGGMTGTKAVQPVDALLPPTQSGGTITRQPNSPAFADPTDILLALATIVSTLLFARFIGGMWRQLCVLLGLVTGAGVACGARASWASSSRG
jgi:xanthine/uracil permease